MLKTCSLLLFLLEGLIPDLFYNFPAVQSGKESCETGNHSDFWQLFILQNVRCGYFTNIILTGLGVTTHIVSC